MVYIDNFDVFIAKMFKNSFLNSIDFKVTHMVILNRSSYVFDQKLST